MSLKHVQARRELEAAQRNYDRLRRMPEEDHFAVGQVLRWGIERGGFNCCAIKTHDALWNVVGRTSSATWDQLVALMGSRWDMLEQSITWEDASVDKPPDSLVVEGTHPERYVLIDTETKTSWRRYGDQWIKIEGEEQ